MRAPCLSWPICASGKIDEAATAAEDLVKHNDKDLTAQSWLGLVRISQQDFPDAERIYKDIVQKDPYFSVGAEEPCADLCGDEPPRRSEEGVARSVAT